MFFSRNNHLTDSRWLNEYDRNMTTTNINNWIWPKPWQGQILFTEYDQNWNLINNHLCLLTRLVYYNSKWFYNKEKFSTRVVKHKNRWNIRASGIGLFQGLKVVLFFSSIPRRRFASLILWIKLTQLFG